MSPSNYTKIMRQYPDVPFVVSQAFLMVSGDNNDLFEVLMLDWSVKNKGQIGQKIDYKKPKVEISNNRNNSKKK